LRKNGEGTELSLTGGKRGRRRVGHNRVMVGNNRRRRRSVEGEVSVVKAGGAPRPFIMAEGGHTGAGRGKRPAVMALTPLMAGRLDDELRSEIKEGNQGVE
jgi:hypothetical protein